MTIQLPETLQYGKVVGRFVLAVADLSSDPDALPNAVPAEGTVSFTSLNARTKEVNANPPTTVIRSVISAGVDAQGLIYNPKDPEGEKGIWLVVGAYKVSYNFKSGSITAHDILVLPEHDDDNPLDLIDALPPGGPILTVSQYAELSSRLDGIEAGAATWDSISSKPTSFPPSAHKSTHASEGADALTPADIGAATPAQVSSGDSATLAAAQSHAQGLVDALTASSFSGDYDDLTDKPTLGTAAATASTDYATAAQGAKADSALQVGAPVPIVALSGAQTTGATHAGKDLHITASSGVDLTVQTAPAGSVIQVRQSGAGALTCVGDGVTLTAMPGMTLISAGQGARFAIVYTSSSAADVLGWMVAA